MSSIRTPEDILLLAKIAQPISFVDRAEKQLFRGGAIDYRLPLMISCERLSVQWTFDTNPTDSTLRGTSNYLYDLLGIYAIKAQNVINNLSGSLPIVTGANDDSVQVGENATFTITVTSSSSYSVAWYRDGILIPGETGLSYTLTNAQLSDSGAVFMAIVTNATGSTNSNNGTLTVEQTITGYAYYGDTYYYDQLLLGIDNITYQINFPITTGQPFVVDFPSGAAVNKFQVYKVPITEPVKNHWQNTLIDGGNIPGFVFNPPLTIGSYRYYVSSEQITIDYTQPMTLSTI